MRPVRSFFAIFTISRCGLSWAIRRQTWWAKSFAAGQLSLRESRQAFDAIDLEIGFAVAGDGHEIKQIRCAQHGMALKELRTGKPVGRAMIEQERP